MPGLVSAGWRGGDRKRRLPWLAGLSLHVAFPVTVPLPGGWKVAQADLGLCRFAESCCVLPQCRGIGVSVGEGTNVSLHPSDQWLLVGAQDLSVLGWRSKHIS